MRLVVVIVSEKVCVSVCVCVYVPECVCVSVVSVYLCVSVCMPVSFCPHEQEALCNLYVRNKDCTVPVLTFQVGKLPLCSGLFVPA